MKLIIISLALFSLSISCLAQDKDSLLVVRKSRLEFMMGKLAESDVLKKRLILKDTAIAKLLARIKVKEDIIGSYKRDSTKRIVETNLLLVKSNLQDERVIALTKDNKRLKKEEGFLIGGGCLFVVTTLLALLR